MHEGADWHAAFEQGYECSVKGFTFYDTSPDTINDLMDQVTNPPIPPSALIRC